MVRVGDHHRRAAHLPQHVAAAHFAAASADAHARGGIPFQVFVLVLQFLARHAQRAFVIPLLQAVIHARPDDQNQPTLPGKLVENSGKPMQIHRQTHSRGMHGHGPLTNDDRHRQINERGGGKEGLQHGTQPGHGKNPGNIFHRIETLKVRLQGFGSQHQPALRQQKSRGYHESQSQGRRGPLQRGAGGPGNHRRSIRKVRMRGGAKKIAEQSVPFGQHAALDPVKQHRHAQQREGRGKFSAAHHLPALARFFAAVGSGSLGPLFIGH